MDRLTLLFHEDRCIACKTCEAACREENDLPQGLSWIEVFRFGPFERDGKLQNATYASRCVHCQDPPCLPACPVGAISQTGEGIVKISEELCIGCFKCLEACPFSAPRWNPRTGTLGICTLCEHRVREGLEPACVKHCWGGALNFGPAGSLIEELQEARAKAEALREGG